MKLFAMCRDCGRAVTVSPVGLCRVCMLRRDSSRRIRSKTTEPHR